MRRDQLEHLLRAASRITDDTEVFVVGSQAILATYDDEELPTEATDSIEADFCFRGDADNEKSDLVDGLIGELSSFHGTFGVYAQGVSITTAVLPDSWDDRLVVLDNESTHPGRGLCLDPHDLVVSKLVAARDKDFDFAAALLREELVDGQTLLDRVAILPIPDDHRSRLATWIEARTT